MAIYQFNRNYLLQIVDRAGGLLFTIKDLHISFDIQKNIDNRSKTNTATLEVKNLSNETLNKISNIQMACQVLLDVGYGDELTRLLTADIKQVKTVRQKGDVITTFEVSEGFMLVNETKISKVYSEDSKVVDVLTDVLSLYGNSNKSITLEDAEIKFPYGYTAIGTLRQVLNDICQPLRLEWNMDGDEIIVKPKRSLTAEAESAKYEKIYVLSEKTGLIGIPSTHNETVTEAYDASAPNELNDNEYDVTEDLKPTKSGKPRKQTRQKIQRFNITCKCLLNPNIKPNGLIRIESTQASELSGTYRVRTVKYKGDNRQGDWTCELYLDNVEGLN